MARPKGFEPLTPRFVVWCSIQLSYGRPPRRTWDILFTKSVTRITPPGNPDSETALLIASDDERKCFDWAFASQSRAGY